MMFGTIHKEVSRDASLQWNATLIEITTVQMVLLSSRLPCVEEIHTAILQGKRLALTLDKGDAAGQVQALQVLACYRGSGLPSPSYTLTLPH